MSNISHAWNNQGVCGHCKVQEPDPYSPLYDAPCPGYWDPIRVQVRLTGYTRKRIDAINLFKQCLGISHREAVDLTRKIYDDGITQDLVVDRGRLDIFLQGLRDNSLEGVVLVGLSPLAKRIVEGLDQHPDVRSEVLFALTYGVR